MLAHSFSFEGVVNLHYDSAILDVPGCDEPGGDCGSCNDCGNPTPACIDGSCVQCGGDADCCPPLVCDAGACVPPEVPEIQ